MGRGHAKRRYGNHLQWRVNGIPDRGYFTFIDRTGQGDFRLAPGNVRW
jgi:hypothetical protein